MRHTHFYGRLGDVNPRRAFTLIELLVVISIIALLVAMLLPTLSKARTIAVQVSCASTMRQIAIGTTAYRMDNRDWLPQFRMAPSVVAWGLGAAAYSKTFEEYWPLGLRYCPSIGKPNAAATFEWTYTAPMLSNDVAAGTFMVDRVTPDDAYVRIIPGPAVFTDGTGTNAPFRDYVNHNMFDPTRSHPLFADYLQNDNASAGCISPHNGGNAFSGSYFGAPNFQISSEGANSIWEDAHLEWHVWPVAARTWPNAYPDGGLSIASYPHALATGEFWDGQTDGWTMSGNQYFRQYWWGKVAILH